LSFILREENKLISPYMEDIKLAIREKATGIKDMFPSARRYSC